MFERYDDNARRVLFFARYEVAQSGGTAIEVEHLVCGALRNRPDTVLRFANAAETADAILNRFSHKTAAERISTSVEIPFSDSCKAVLSHGATEADALRNKTIRPEHLILGILVKAADRPAARTLRDAGVDPEAIRDYLRGMPDDARASPSVERVMSVHAERTAVARQWKGVVKPGRADDYVRHLQSETLPALRRLAGFDTVTIMRRDVEDGVEFQVTTYWRSLDAIKAFAGEDVTRAVVPPAAQALMVRYDERAVHYDIVQ